MERKIYYSQKRDHISISVSTGTTVSGSATDSLQDKYSLVSVIIEVLDRLDLLSLVFLDG